MRFIKPAILGILLGILISLLTCSKGIRLIPKYEGVDPRAEPYVTEWLSLANQAGLKFDEKVTVSFTNIGEPPIIGLTNYGLGFKEIDLDESAWKNFTEVKKTALVFHELCHAYCNRHHDFGPGRDYPKDEVTPNFKSGGYFADGCSISIMSPYIQEDSCILTHYDFYIKEMFDRCDAL